MGQGGRSAGRAPAVFRPGAVALLLSLAAVAPAAGQTAEQVRAALADVMRDGDLQQELPSRSFSPPRATDGQAPTPAPEEPASRTKLSSWLLWLLLALGLGCGAVVLGRVLSGWRPASRRRPVPAAPATAAPAAPATPAAPSEEADRLAAEGRLAEAVHRLLLDALELLRRRGEALAPALTAREILRRVRPPAAEGEALGLLVPLVERCWFGSARPTLEEYRRCRDSVARLRGGAAA
ncbi:MAG: DUF4129 domain-containing protein [Dongiaceae bacterium]